MWHSMDLKSREQNIDNMGNTSEKFQVQKPNTMFVTNWNITRPITFNEPCTFAVSNDKST